MREEEQTSCFSYWEDQADQLPSPEELIPITQTLITTDLANAFSIKPNHNPPPSSNAFNPPPLPPSSNEFNPPPLPPSSMLAGSPRSDEPARTLKRPRLTWTPELHKQFVAAVDHLGLKNAVPKEILQVMGVEGLTRDKVASHLQKYRLYLRRMRHLLDSSGVSIATAGQPSPSAPVAGQPSPSAPVLQNFLERGGRPPCGEWSQEHCLPFMPTDMVLQHQQHQMAAAVPQQHVMQHQHSMGLFGLPAKEQIEHGFLERQQQEVHSMVPSPVPASSELAYVEDLEPVAGRERKLLRLFPTGDD